ncbi:MAG: hypothetical protein LBU55_04375 [Elusimicrobiota bacterium]|jgi:cell division protein FtsL|nr:hypothetical protein [Elusimicrobiota bacterium]
MHSRKSIFIGNIVMLVIVLLFLKVFLKAHITRSREKISILQHALENIVSENEDIQSDIALSLSLEKMHKFAKEKNLKPPDENSIIYVD